MSIQMCGPMTTRVLQRQIMPVEKDLDVLALYVEGEHADVDRGDPATSSTTGRNIHPQQIESRTSVRVRSGERLSFGTYFNAFAAGYWRRWTSISAIRLAVEVSGLGANVVVYRSTADGRFQRVDAGATDIEGEATFVFDLELEPFVDGGWYWYDVIADEDDVLVRSATWSANVPEEHAAHGSVDVVITTMNRPDFCAKLLGQLGDDTALSPYLDEVLVVEQGSNKVASSGYFAKAEAALGDKLRIVEQGNLGGSGGYARGQLESFRKGSATYALMIDDDVVAEPEGIVRALTFADLCNKPTIVGGHMFSLYARAHIHSFGEIVEPLHFWWQAAHGVENNWDLAARNLRSTPWMHRRVDVDYNGWFMCLIPHRVLETIGLALPLFLKWDDSEYGLRAKKAGYATVTLPGAAVWHVPWTDKNDAVDWQAYLHQRNRFIAALLHSQYPRGGRMLLESLAHQVKHLVSMQYSTVAIRCRALVDVLAGPDSLHQDLPAKVSEVREFVEQFDDAQLEMDRNTFPPIHRKRPARLGGGYGGLRKWTASIRQFRRSREMSRLYPEAEIAAMDASWFQISSYDSAIVSMNDGRKTAFYKRDRKHFRKLLASSLRVHLDLFWQWKRVSRQYRARITEITSPEAWEETFRPWREADLSATRGDNDSVSSPN